MGTGGVWARAGVLVVLLVLGGALALAVDLSAMSALVGLVAGFGPGVAVAFAGGLLAALGAFGLSRTLGRSAATCLAGPRLARVDALMDRRGIVAVLAGRLLPMVPFVVLSYGAGLTSVRWAPYAAGTALGLLPSTVVQVGVGASAGAIAAAATPLTVVPVLAGAVVPAALATGAWRRRTRATA